MKSFKPTGPGALLTAVILMGGVLRFIYLGRESIWFDEALSDWFSSLPMDKLWREAPGYETHPPLFYTMLKVWKAIFGNSEAALRSFAAMAGTMTIPLVYLLGRVAGGQAKGQVMGLAAAAIFALAPIHIAYGQDARPYTFLVFFATLGLLGALWLAANPMQAARPYMGLAGPAGPETAGPVKLAWAALILGTALSLWLHNMGFTLAAALVATTAAGLLWKTGFSRAYMINAALAAALILLIYSPFIPWFARQVGNVHTSFWQKPINIGLIGEGLSYVFFLFMSPFWIKGLMMALAGYGLAMIHRQRGALVSATLAGAMLIPFLIEISLSYLFTPIYVARTMIWASVPFYVLVAGALAGEGKPVIKMALVTLVVAGLIQGDLARFRHKKEPWREMVALVASKAKAGDTALIIPNSAAIAFSYYTTRMNVDLKLIPLPAPFPAIGLDRPYPSGNTAEPAFTWADAHLLDGLDCENQSIWLVTWFRTRFDPEMVAFKKLSEKCQMVESGGYPSLHVIHFARKTGDENVEPGR